MPRNLIRHPSVLLVAACALAATALSGCSAPAESTAGQQPTDPADAPGRTVQVGDCLIGGDDPQPQVVACDEPHEQEAYFVVDAGGGPDYPSADRVAETVAATCADQFAMFIGLEVEHSVLDWAYRMPSRQAWNDGERGVACVAFDPLSEVSGTLQGALR